MHTCMQGPPSLVEAFKAAGLFGHDLVLPVSLLETVNLPIVDRLKVAIPIEPHPQHNPNPNSNP